MVAKLVALALRRQGQMDCEFQASLGYTVRYCLKEENKMHEMGRNNSCEISKSTLCKNGQ